MAMPDKAGGRTPPAAARGQGAAPSPGSPPSPRSSPTRALGPPRLRAGSPLASPGGGGRRCRQGSLPATLSSSGWGAPVSQAGVSGPGAPGWMSGASLQRRRPAGSGSTGPQGLRLPYSQEEGKRVAAHQQGREGDLTPRPLLRLCATGARPSQEPDRRRTPTPTVGHGRRRGGRGTSPWKASSSRRRRLTSQGC